MPEKDGGGAGEEKRCDRGWNQSDLKQPVEGRWRLSDFRATKEVKCEGCSADLEMVPMVGDGADLGMFNQNCWKKKRNRRRWKGKRKGNRGNNLGL